MTSIRVRFFASLREQLGREYLELTSRGTTDIATLWQRLEHELPADAIAALRSPGVKLALNQELVNGNVRLKPGDELAFLPPVTGG